MHPPAATTATNHVDRANGLGHPAPDATASHLKRNVWIVVGVLVLIVLLGGSYVGYRYLDSTINYVSSDNARVASPSVPVGALNAGQVTSLSVDVGSKVRKGDVLARIEVPSTVRTLQNGAPELEYRGAADQSADVVSPLNGIVLAVPAAVGQTVSPGAPVVTLMDPSQAWISANVDENDIARVQVGQTVQAYIPAAQRSVNGKVIAITPATASSFLPAPATNATGDYTNPGQLVPVKISIQDSDVSLFIGATAQVRIRVT